MIDSNDITNITVLKASVFNINFVSALIENLIIRKKKREII